MGQTLGCYEDATIDEDHKEEETALKSHHSFTIRAGVKSQTTANEPNFPTEGSAYTISGAITKDSRSTIYSAYCFSKDREVACKVRDLSNTSKSYIAQVMNECTYTASLRHPNLVSSLSAFCYGGQCWIIMPLMHCSVHDILKTSYPNGFENERWIERILSDVLNGLEYIHELKFVHRDIKASAILMNTDGVAKISDFGMVASRVDSSNGRTFAGTPAFMAPEIIDETKHAVPLSDIWSFGITALELVSGKPPRSQLTLQELLAATLNNGPPDVIKSAGRPISSDFKQILYSCLVKDAEGRKSASELKKMPFFQQLMAHVDLAKALRLDEEYNLYVTIDEDEAPASLNKDLECDFKVAKGNAKTIRKGDGALKNIVMKIGKSMSQYTVGEMIEVLDPETGEWNEAQVQNVNDDGVAVATGSGELKKFTRSCTRRKRFSLADVTDSE